MLLAVDLAVRHAFTDADGNAVTSVQLGQEFHFRTYVQDVRSSPRGVFQAYFDVTYAADLASVDGAISHLPEYTAETSGNTSTPGRIIGAGGRDWDQYASAPGVEFPLFTVPFQADKAGTLAPVLNVHSDPNGIKLVQFFDSVGQVQPENIGFSGPSLEIVNTNAPLLAISAIDTDKGEGNSGTTPFTFTVTRTVVTTGTTIVNYAVAGSGTYPANAADFGGTLPSGQISFAAGETSKAVTINVSGDTVVESDEGFTVTLSSVSGGATITTPTASGTIRNDDIALRVDDVLAVAVGQNEGRPGAAVALQPTVVDPCPSVPAAAAAGVVHRCIPDHRGIENMEFAVPAACGCLDDAQVTVDHQIVKIIPIAPIVIRDAEVPRNV